MAPPLVRGLGPGVSAVDKLTYLDRVKEFIGSLRGTARRHLLGGQIGVKLAAEHILDISNYYVPIEFGPLKESGKVELTTARYSFGHVMTEASVVYEAPYAVHVHDRPDLRHGEEYNTYYAADIAAGIKTKRRPQEQFKFLERAIREGKSEAVLIIATAMRRKK